MQQTPNTILRTFKYKGLKKYVTVMHLVFHNIIVENAT